MKFNVLSQSENFDLERRFGGVGRLYGLAGAQKIFNAHVVVVGIGGVGSWVVEALARSGVGHLTLIDMDHISESNINRQVHSLGRTLGQSKCLAMKDRVLDIHPFCDVQIIDDFVQPENWLEMVSTISQPIDFLIDACDQVKAKVSLASWSIKSQVDMVCIGAAGGKKRADLMQMGDLLNVTHDPMLAKLRHSLRKEGALSKEHKKSSIQCVFSKEEIINPWRSEEDSNSLDVIGVNDLNCHGYGSSVAVTASFGLCAAGWVLERLSNLADESNS